MNGKGMWILVIVALFVGAYGGYAYEKAKFVKLMAAQRDDMQRQIDDAKLTSDNDATIQQNLVMMATDDKVGTYATDAKGMALYTYDKDTAGQSTCTGECAVKWPPYIVVGEAPTVLPEHLGTIKRADGTMQYTWDGKPLYYYITDKSAKDVYGDGVGGVWHVAK